MEASSLMLMHVFDDKLVTQNFKVASKFSSALAEREKSQLRYVFL